MSLQSKQQLLRYTLKKEKKRVEIQAEDLPTEVRAKPQIPICLKCFREINGAVCQPLP